MSNKSNKLKKNEALFVTVKIGIRKEFQRRRRKANVNFEKKMNFQL